MRPPARNVQAPVGLHAHGLGGSPRGHPRHDTSACRLRLLVRLPVDVKEWVAQEALDRGCSMNAVIVDALNAKITSVFGETQNKKHAAAIKAVIDIEQLPKGTAILMPPSHRQRETDLLVRRPADVDYGLLARVSGEDATYAEDDVSAKAMEPLHPSARNGSRRASIPPPERIGLSRVEAAELVGVSPALFDDMVKDGRMPPPRQINDESVWGREQLEQRLSNSHYAVADHKS